MKQIILSAFALILSMPAAMAQTTAPAEDSAKKTKMVIKYIDGKWDTTYVDSNAPKAAKDSLANEDDEVSFRDEFDELRKELKEIKPKKKKVDKSSFSLELGSNGFMQNGGFNLNGSNLALRTENGLNKSIGWGFTFNRSENLIREKLRFNYGLGFEFNNYRLRDDSILTTARDTVRFIAPTNPGLTRNTMHISWVNIPVMLQFTTNPYRQSKAFNIAVGAEFGVRIGNLRTAQRYELGNDTYQEVSTRGPQNTSFWKASLVARAGYGDVDLFVRYGITELFRQDVNINPGVTPVMAGLSFRL